MPLTGFRATHAHALLQTTSLHVLLQAAACRRMVGDLKEAAEVYEHGMSPLLHVLSDWVNVSFSHQSRSLSQRRKDEAS